MLLWFGEVSDGRIVKAKGFSDVYPLMTKNSMPYRLANSSTHKDALLCTHREDPGNRN